MIIISMEKFKEQIGNIDIKLLITACKMLNVQYTLATADDANSIEDQVLKTICTHSDWTSNEVVALYRPFDINPTMNLTLDPNRLICILFKVPTVEALIKVLSKIDSIKAFL